MRLTFVRSLDPRARREAMQHTFSIWSEGRSLEAHVAYQNEQLERATHAVLEYSGLVDETGALVGSLKRFALSMRIGEELVPTIGLGAVMVPESFRRRGVGRKLIEAALDEARASGARLAWLFSEIDPAFYARLGFKEVEWPIFACEVSALPSGGSLELRSIGAGFPEENHRELERLDSARFAPRPGTLRPARERRAREYFAWRNEIETSWLTRPDGTIAAYVAFSAEAERSDSVESLLVLEVADWGWAGVTDHERLAGLRRIAETRGATHVAGPLGEDGAAGHFGKFVSDAHGAPMLAVLDPDLVLEESENGKVSADRVHFGLCDYF